MSDNLSREDSIKEIARIIADIKFALLTTTNAEGHLHARPMTTQQAEFGGDLWFIGARDSGSVADIRLHPRVNVSYADTGKGSYVSVSGVGELVEDRAKLEELWSDFYKAYFQGGIDDPNVQLIKVEATGAEFWESEGKVKSYFQMARAAVTGKTADMGKNETVKL
jgi:general stress protein 26